MSSNKEIIMEVLDIAITVGVPAITELIDSLGKDEISSEDIADLRTKIKQNPEEYFS